MARQKTRVSVSEIKALRRRLGKAASTGVGLPDEIQRKFERLLAVAYDSSRQDEAVQLATELYQTAETRDLATTLREQVLRYCQRERIVPAYKISERYDLREDKHTPIPSAGGPGCYVWFSESGLLLYVGRARYLGSRVSDYLLWRTNSDPLPKPVHRWTEPPRYVYTIPVKGLGDEAALESFLIRELDPVDNVAGRSSR